MFSTNTNPDGSYQTILWNAQDYGTTTTYDANGHQLSQSSSQGTGINYDTTDHSNPTTLSDGQGDTTTDYHDSQGNLTNDSWSAADGTYGTDTFNASGAIEGKRFNTDGSSDTFSLYQTPEGTFSNFTLSPGNPIALSGPLDITRVHYAPDGTLSNDQWNLGDGSSGSDTFNADGSGSGTLTHVDVTTSSMTLDAQGEITIDNQDAQGNKSSEDWWHSDGTHGITTYASDGSKVTYTYEKRHPGPAVNRHRTMRHSRPRANRHRTTRPKDRYQNETTKHACLRCFVSIRVTNVSWGWLDTMNL